MEHLGFDRDRYAFYEGERTNGYRIMPPPSVTPIRFMDNGIIPEINRGHEQLPLKIFREDDFDTVTKIKRGRVFKCSEELQPQQWYASDAFNPPRSSIMQRKSFMQAPEGTISTKLTTYIPDMLFDYKNLSQVKVILGQDSHITFWEIISAEANIVGTPVLLLKATQSYNDIPKVINANLNEKIADEIKASLEKIESSINRQSALEVIDRCRDTLSIAFGHRTGDPSKDLSEAINSYVKQITKGVSNTKGDDLCASAGRIVARLHSRGKPNEQNRLNIPAPTEHDADLALNCMRLILRELGYATCD